jgi:uncharacterized membrane protein
MGMDLLYTREKKTEFFGTGMFYCKIESFIVVGRYQLWFQRFILNEVGCDVKWNCGFLKHFIIIVH